MSKLRQQLIEELVLRGCAERTQEAYVQQVRQLAGHFGQAPDRLSEGQVREYLLHLARERQLAASTINQAVCAIRFFYERVLHREVSVLRQALPFTRKPVLRPQVYATGELEKLFTVGCPHPKHRAFLMTVYGAGLRLNEACHLKAEHLDAARQQIRIVQGKGRKDRYTLLSPRLLEELRAYWRMFRPQHWLFPATRTPERPMVDATGQRIYYQAVQRAGLRRKGGIHALRHSFATHLLEAGVEITVVQRLLGHSSLNTTSTYLHVRQERLAQIAGPLQLLELSRLPAAA
ncbi:MAG: site-specific integrase [Verrucomicrobiales bacterium]|nr:site-specific integrase [Verrucomicrobiales bacterium]MCP5527863.1 site-specific integrase [Verrucomicrobiales bacterium]MCP5528501.1 site-specific integrase [Verrucomicrobiales bacterium]MCP5528505.1 site-specific integrase [Verrucomicrobiales bacterium]MCP5528517.1 site-specific integrase [Verrucomicrobiales bacterium]